MTHAADADQMEWHKHGKQGCMYAQVLSRKFDPENPFWIRKVLELEIQEELILEIKSVVDACVQNDNNQAISIIIPKIQTVADLIKFLTLLKYKYPAINFEVDETSIENHTLIAIRLPSILEPDKSFWVLGFGNFDFFPKTRQSPAFEIVLATKTKEYLYKKYNRFSHFQPTEHSKNRGGKLDSAHLADMQIEGITEKHRKDNSLWDSTKNLKEAVLGEMYGDIRSKAKNSFTLEGTHKF